MWDVPPKPEHGDNLAETTFAAVGKALSAWERLELELVVVYAAILQITPPEATRKSDYKNAVRFVERLKVVEESWNNYIIAKHNQAIESHFLNLIKDINGLSQRRNDIAHGIVVPLWSENSSEEFVLLPAMYRDKRFSEIGEPDFVYSSIEMERFQSIFDRCTIRCTQIRQFLYEGIMPYPMSAERRTIPFGECNSSP